MNSKDKALVVGPMGNPLGLSRLINSMFADSNNIFDLLWNNNNLTTQIFDDIQPKGTFPKINVSETDKAYDVEIAVAGFNKDDIELELKDNTFYVKGEVKNEEEDKKYLRREISYRSFRRAVRFPEKIDPDAVTCDFENGIIKCTVGKKVVVEDSPVKITIK